MRVRAWATGDPAYPWVVELDGKECSAAELRFYGVSIETADSMLVTDGQVRRRGLTFTVTRRRRWWRRGP